MRDQSFLPHSSILFILPIVFAFWGCSIIGFSVGDVEPDYSNKMVLELEPGDHIRILRNDSVIAEGNYRRLELLDPATYGSIYNEFLKQVEEDVTFPALGDTLFLKTSHLVSVGVFRGFGMNAFYLETPTEHIPTMVPLFHLSRLQRADGTTFDHKALHSFDMTNPLPFNQSLVLEYEEGLSTVHLNDVTRLEKRNRRIAKWIGGAIGLAIDVAIIVAIIAGVENFGHLLGSGR